MAGQYLTGVVLEFSEDDLSDVTPTWVDVTADCQGLEWWSGVDREGVEPAAGGATIRMRNTSRRWEPDFAAGQFYPNITTHRRFRLTLDDAAGSAVQQGLWYVTDIAVDYPLGTELAEVTFTCSDGFEVLALDDLPGLDPPDAGSYADVVGFDEPWGYWRLGEHDGTQARANIVRWTRTVRRHGEKMRRKFRARRGTRYSIAAEAGAVAGPSGVYKTTGLLALGEPGAIVGDADTSVMFATSAGSEGRVSVPIDDTDSLNMRRRVTVEAWVKPTTTSLRYVVTGPRNNTQGPPWALNTQSNEAQFTVRVAPSTDISAATGGSNVPIDAWTHVVGTYDEGVARIYTGGVLRATGGGGDGALVTPTAGNALYIGYSEDADQGFDGWIDEVAVYEHALTAERVLAHYQAGAERGYAEQTAGARIAAIATHALWSEANIQTTGRNVQPEMQTGQARLGEIGELAHAEGPRTMFFFNGTGDPVYLGHEWQATAAAYNTTQATVGDQPGEVDLVELEPVYDNETYNEVTASHESGEAVTAGDGTPPPRRANTEFTDVLLVEHVEVESLAEAVLAFYADPQFRFETVTLSGSSSPAALNHILRRQIGHQIRVKKSGVSGARTDRVCNIVGVRCSLTRDKLLTCTWALSRGFNALEGVWRAGIVGFSEAGSTTVAG